MGGLRDRLKHAWNAFVGQGEEPYIPSDVGSASYGGRPDRPRGSYSNERSIISSIYTRLAIDVSSVGMRHVRLDADDRYIEDIDSGLNRCLTLEANIDQGPKAFWRDAVYTMLERGVVGIIPVDTSISPTESGSFDIKTMRTGEVVAWYPRHVRFNVYNDNPKVGTRQEITLEKRAVAIVENPFYAVMNEPNSTLKRLIHKLNLLDKNDEQQSAGKLDLIIQLPYVIKSEARRQQAEQRRQDIEFQLRTSQHGIAYTDGTEKIVQLNRPVENSLLAQIEYLTKLLYSQLGLTQEVMNGTADEKTMLNYRTRTIEPILDAIVEAMKRSFLTQTGRSQGQSIAYFQDPFKLVPIADVAEVVDKFTRNEILTSNEFRQILGYRPSKDPNADKLRNSNMPQPDTGVAPDSSGAVPPAADTAQQDAIMNDLFDGLNSDIDSILLQKASANGSG